MKRHLAAALLVLVLSCLAGVGLLVHRSQRAEIESNGWEKHSYEVILQLGDLLSSLKDAETGQRGFIITGKPDYLEPYQSSLAEIAIGLASLRRLTADNPRQQQRLDALAPLVAAKLAEIKETIALRETQGFSVASAAVTAKSGMDEVRALVAQAQAEEAQLLKERVATHETDKRKTIQAVMLGSALGGLAMLLLFVRLQRELAGRQRAETVSRASGQQLRLATDAAELGIWTWQPDGDRITWENDRPYAILGMPRTDARLTVARFEAEFIHPEDLAAFKRAIADTVQNGVRLFYQGRFHCPDGALRWIEFTGRPMPGTEGPSLRLLGTVQDITRRKQADALVARQAAELAALYATAPASLFFLDTDLRCVRVNPAMAELSGLPAERHIGRTLREILTPELADVVESQVRLVLETGRPLLNCEVHGATTHRPGEQRHWLVSYQPVQAGDATISGVQSAVQEITVRKQAEEALRESEQRFRALVLASSDLMCRMSPDWSQMRQVYDKNFALKAEVPDGNWLESYVYRDDQPRLLALVNEAIRTKSPFEMEHRVRLVDGSWGWMLSRAVPLLDASGEIVEWFGTGSDVTEKKRAEKSLRESEERYRSLFNSIDEGFCLIEMIFDAREQPVDYRFLEVNPAFEQLTGLHDATGKRIRELVPDQDQFWFEIYGKVALTGEAIRFVNEAKAMEGRWFDVYATRLGGSESRKVVLLFNNITERKTAEEALRQSEERLRLAAEAAHFGMYDRDMRGAYFHVSAQGKQMLGYAPDAPLGHAQVMSHMHPDDRLAGLAAFQRACDPAGDGRIAVEQRIVRRDGAVRWISTVGQVLFEDGAPRRSIGFWVDITERKEAELALRAANIGLERRVEERTRALDDKARELERASRVKSEFLASMSHELRTPLNGIIGFTEFLHDEKPGPLLPKQKEYLGDVLDSARHLLELINEVLDIAKVEAGKIELHPLRFSVAQAIEEARTVLQGSADKKRIAISIGVGGGLDAVMLDPLRFKQVLYNLLSNAVKFSDEGGRVEIHARCLAPNQLEVQVRDNGIGIKAADIGQLFTEFGRFDSGAARRAEGTGLGLALTKKLIELQGGRIGVRSTAGQGSVFTVVLPLVTDQAGQAGQADQADQAVQGVRS